MNFATMKTTYGTTDPPYVAGNHVTFRIDGQDYLDGLDAAFKTVGRTEDAAGNPLTATDNSATGDFIYIAGWWLGLVGGQWTKPPASGQPSLWSPGQYDPFPFRGGDDLIDVLKAKAAAGVDVRVMGWCHQAVLNSYRVMNAGGASTARENAMTVESIRALRADAHIGDKAILNVVHHTAGAAHPKLIVVGDNTRATGFTGGLDLVIDRVVQAGDDDRQPWHDVMAEVSGPGVQGLYDWFTLMWTENTTYDGARRDPVTIKIKNGDLPHVLPTTPQTVPTRTLSGGGGGTTHVQSLRTLPARDYKFFSIAPSALKVSWPDAGEFKLRAAWEKAIKAAETYIYMEDQAFQSVEVFEWIHDRLQAAPDLKVILVTGAGKDPNDPDLASDPFLCESLNRSLLKSPGANPDRVRLFQRWGQHFAIDTDQVVSVTPNGATTTVVLASTAPADIPADVLSAKRNYFLSQAAADALIVGNPAMTKGTAFTVTVPTGAPPAVLTPGPVDVRTFAGVFVHTKTTIVDDRWAIVGSANCMRRSLYTDCEHAVALLDEPDGAAIKAYRKRLWAHHFRRSDPDEFDDIQESLHAWEPTWGTAGAAPARPARGTGVPGPGFIDPVALPLLNCQPMTPEQQELYDVLLDADSRQPWGFIFPPNLNP